MALLILGLLLLGSGSLSAAVYTFIPSPADLNDLPHEKYFSWGIPWSHPNEVITEAVISIKGIYDWTHENNDSLYIHLLNDPQLGVKQWSDGERGGDNWNGKGPWIATWSDPYGDPQHKANLSYSLSSRGLIDDLNNIVTAKGKFGFGFDSDCHYYNDSVKVVITTEVVPEPTTITLLGIGLAGLGMCIRRKN